MIRRASSRRECLALVIGGVEDQNDAPFAPSRNHPITRIVEEVEKGSSERMEAAGPRNPAFRWQAGHGAFSVSGSHSDAARRPIRG